MIECALFDSDGTLVDSELICNQGIAIMFEELGVQLDVQRLMLQYRGGKMSEVLAELCEQNNLSLPADFLPRYRALVSDMFEAQLKPIEGVVDVLEALDMPVAVVSNGPWIKIEQALDICGLRHYFKDNIYSANELQYWKPDPQLYLNAAKNMGFSASQCAVIEDSPTGVQAGINANMTTCYYDKFNQPFDNAKVIHFNSMHNLVNILHRT
jgi:HAD superfamily hydrolase (TIGR01509 family)